MKFEIKQVGRISKAAIELKRLTILVGKNDTGKTYVSSTIWSVIELIKNNQKYDELINSFFPEIGLLISNLEAEADCEGDFAFEITAKNLNNFRKSIIKKINSELRVTLEDAIGYDGFEKSSFDIAINHKDTLQLKIKIKIKRFDRVEDLGNLDLDHDTHHEIDEVVRNTDADVDFECILINKDNNKELFNVTANDINYINYSGFIPQYVKDLLIGYSCFGREWEELRSIVYLPAARTGIMLALDYFMAGSINRTAGLFFKNKDEFDVPQSLPAPIRSFARDLSWMSFFHDKDRDSPLYKIIKGDLKRGRKRGAFFYTPEGLDYSIPLTSASSLVTELAAFSIISKVPNRASFIIFEEPEAHLHLEAQRDMARAIAHLINKTDTKVLITSHSDTFIQQINNLITISDHPKKNDLKEQLELSENDLIQRESVAAYEFVCNEGVTTVNQLELTKTGFFVNSLNEVLTKLARETYLINDGLMEKE